MLCPSVGEFDPFIVAGGPGVPVPVPISQDGPCPPFRGQNARYRLVGTGFRRAHAFAEKMRPVRSLHPAPRPPRWWRGAVRYTYQRRWSADLSRQYMYQCRWSADLSHRHMYLHRWSTDLSRGYMYQCRWSVYRSAWPPAFQASRPTGLQAYWATGLGAPAEAPAVRGAARCRSRAAWACWPLGGSGPGWLGQREADQLVWYGEAGPW